MTISDDEQHSFVMLPSGVLVRIGPCLDSDHIVGYY